MGNRLTNYLVLLILYVFSSGVWADGKIFKIELLVFAQDMPSSEVFDQFESKIQWPRRLADLTSYQQVAAEHMSLQGIVGALRRTAGYRPLMHVAWTQSVNANTIGTAVHIQNSTASIDGFFRIQRGHYLHMLTELEYRPNGSPVYRIDEKRRFKLNEIHYLDHPKFGIIARISPLS